MTEMVRMGLAAGRWGAVKTVPLPRRLNPPLRSRCWPRHGRMIRGRKLQGQARLPGWFRLALAWDPGFSCRSVKWRTSNDVRGASPSHQSARCCIRPRPESAAWPPWRVSQLALSTGWMNRWGLLIGCGAIVLVLAGVALLLFTLPARTPVSVSFVGIRNGGAGQEAVVRLTNASLKMVSCRASLSAIRGHFEFVANTSFGLAAKSDRYLAVTVPRGEEPLRVVCGLETVRQHPAWICRLGAWLDKRGVHVYHVRPSVSSMLRVQVRAPLNRASLSDLLVWQSLTNQWSPSLLPSNTLPFPRGPVLSAPEFHPVFSNGVFP